jgi:phosphoribosylanthranilate isomerase
MNIKVCGITQLKQLQQLDALNVDFAGLIFYDKSPRFIGNSITPEELRDADFDIKKVGVFVNATEDEILTTVEAYSLDIVQLHGDETPAFCEEISEEVEVIKAIRIGDNATIDSLIKEYDAVCDYYLFDTSSTAYGGSGKKFDWQILAKAKIEKPFFLSGGIGIDDIDNINAFHHPDLFGVDINSKFETAPGIKDLSLVVQFKQALKKK